MKWTFNIAQVRAGSCNMYLICRALPFQTQFFIRCHDFSHFEFHAFVFYLHFTFLIKSNTAFGLSDASSCDSTWPVVLLREILPP